MGQTGAASSPPCRSSSQTGTRASPCCACCREPSSPVVTDMRQSKGNLSTTLSWGIKKIINSFRTSMGNEQMPKRDSKPCSLAGGCQGREQSPGQGCHCRPEGEEGEVREDGHQWSCRCWSRRGKCGLDLPLQNSRAINCLELGQGAGHAAQGKPQRSCDPNRQGLGGMEAMENLFGATSALLGARSDFWPCCRVWRGPLAAWVPAPGTRPPSTPGSGITIVPGLPMGWDPLQRCVVWPRPAARSRHWEVENK